MEHPEAESDNNVRIYKRLDPARNQTRVLRLHAGSGKDTLCATLVVIPLPEYRNRNDDNRVGTPHYISKEDAILGLLEYEAVSYCWDNPNITTEVILNGQPFQAPASAAKVLQRFRYADKPRYLWLDALSINQDDLDEKAEQVLKMGNIYANASNTLVWLGECDRPEIEEAVKVCQAVGQRLDSVLAGPRNGNGPEAKLSGYEPSETFACIIPRGLSLDSLNWLFASKWFSRIWVVQEVFLSRRSICYIGKFSVSWVDVTAAAYYFSTYAYGREIFDPVIKRNLQMPIMMFLDCYLHRFMPTKMQGPTMWTANLSLSLQSCIHLNATDPRDMIYGLLGMINRTRGIGTPLLVIRPDYRISIRDCMRNATRAMIMQDDNLTVLDSWLTHIRGEPRTGKPGWPTWTPRWHQDNNPHAVSKRAPSSHGRADRGRRMWLRDLYFEPDPDVLHLEGIRVDTIADSYVKFYGTGNDIDIYDWRTIFVDALCYISARRHKSIGATLLNLLTEQFQGHRISAEDTLFLEIDGIASQIACSYLAYRQNHAEDYQDAVDEEDRDFEMWAQITEKTRLLAEDAELERELWDRVLKETKQRCLGGAIAQTTSGRMIIGPLDLDEDDVIAVLFGGKHPFILRPDGEYYRMIGPCYAEEVMYGEAVAELEEKNGVSQILKIW